MVPKLTASGKNLLLRALAGETITFTKIQLGNGTAQDPAEATGLANPIITVELSKIVVGTEYVTLTAQFSNSSITSGFHITEAGFFAKDPDDSTKEILYALGNEDESSADYVPDKGNRILEMQFDALIFIGDAENVSAAISSSLVYASKEDFDKHTADKNNPHSVTKQQVGLGNVPNLAPSDQVPTFTEATTLANIVSGEKASTLFGKIKLAISKLIDHLNNRSNPHNTTAAQVGAAAKSHTHNAQDINAGTLSVLRGGTGLSSPTNGAVILGQGNSALRAYSWYGALYSSGTNNPRSGTLPVAYGGTGCTSLTALATALATADSGLGKIVTGSYSGTGGYGTNNKKSLTFSAPPKLLVVMPASNASNGQRGGFIALRGISSSRAGGIMDDVSGNWGQLYYTWDGNTVTWYSPNNEYSQQNLNGMTYYYFAIL